MSFDSLASCPKGCMTDAANAAGCNGLDDLQCVCSDDPDFAVGSPAGDALSNCLAFNCDVNEILDATTVLIEACAGALFPSFTFTGGLLPTLSPTATSSSRGGRGSSIGDSDNSNSGGLSTGAKAGIGVGVALVVLIALGLVAFCFIMKRKKKKNRPAPGGAPPVSQYGPPSQGVPAQNMNMPPQGMPQYGQPPQGMQQYGPPPGGMPQYGVPPQGAPPQFGQQQMYGAPPPGPPQYGAFTMADQTKMGPGVGVAEIDSEPRHSHIPVEMAANPPMPLTNTGPPQPGMGGSTLGSYQPSELASNYGSPAPTAPATLSVTNSPSPVSAVSAGGGGYSYPAPPSELPAQNGQGWQQPQPGHPGLNNDGR